MIQIFQIKDKYALGVLGAFIGKIGELLFNFLFYSLGLESCYIWQIAAATFITESEINTPAGIFIGIISDATVALTLGVLLAYILYRTGTDYAYLKGLSIGLLYWVLFYGIGLRLGVSQINPNDAVTNIFHLLSHVLLALITTGVIVKFGKAQFRQ